MRRCYLVCYDIRDPKRWRQVFKVMKGHGEHWQYSVFFCVLKPIDQVRMQTQLEEAMNLKEDQTMIIDLGSDENRLFRFWVRSRGKLLFFPGAGSAYSGGAELTILNRGSKEGAPWPPSKSNWMHRKESRSAGTSGFTTATPSR
jgi:CRISPR-associated protein Cas2